MRRGEAAEAWRGILARQKKLRRAAALKTVIAFWELTFLFVILASFASHYSGWLACSLIQDMTKR